MQTAQILFATLTGAFAGVVFGLVDAPIPAPPELAGVMGIVGIYVGYKAIEYLDLVGDVANVLPF
jgi:XapX domain-containing protein